jgi:hypothetical protein
MKSRVVLARGLSAAGRLALSPSQRARLRRIVNTFDAAVERERAHRGALGAEQMRAKGIAFAEINSGLHRSMSFCDVRALAERGLLSVATARIAGIRLHRGGYDRWLGGSVERVSFTARVTPTDEGRRQIAATEGAIMAEQVWIVFLDGIAQKDVLPFASSEEKALSMWRERTSLGPVARARLRAVPKTDDRAAIALFIARNLAHKFRDEDADINGADLIDCVARALGDAGFIAEARAASSGRFHPIPKKAPALAVVQNIALLFRDEDEEINGADFVDFVSRELDEAGFLAEARAGAGVHREPVPSSRVRVITAEEEALTADELAALRGWADEQRPRWKAALRLAWETGDYRGSEHDADLQRIRNRLGPSWLAKYHLPGDSSRETSGYHCWVVTSKKPYRALSWVSTRRKEAVARVKDAVLEHKSEGGVESRDPGKPFEVTFSVLRGKLITTKHTD